MKTVLRSLAVLIIASAPRAFALQPGDVVEDFRLIDEQGHSHQLSYLSDKKAIVIMTQGNGCQIVRSTVPTLKAIRDKYESQGVEFLMMNSNLQDSRDAVAKESADFGYQIPIMMDTSQLIGESMGVTRTAEVFVIDPKNWHLMYHGPVDDRLSYGVEKPKATHAYLEDALTSVLSSEPVKVASAQSAGCLVEMPEANNIAAHARISYSKTIAPLLEQKCVACHREGGGAPFAMSSYQMVKGYSPMVREVIRVKRMPPWHADPHYGTFVGDRSLTVAQAQTLVHWIEAGAPRGSGPDPLLKVKPDLAVWKHGKPDLIIDVPPFDIPATGVIDYQYQRVHNPLGHDAWIAAIELHPGNKQTVHHILAFMDDRAVNPSPNGSRQGNIQVGGYAPGLAPVVFEEGTGMYLPTDADFVFQMHYTANGKAMTDRSQVGLYFLKEPPKYPIHTGLMANFRFTIAPGEQSHTEVTTKVWDKDAIVYSIMPHAHMRGKAAKMTAYFPDGRSEVLLNVPKYEFAWQTDYAFTQPLMVPKDTKFVWEMTWDNSAQNLGNPDPTKTVHWGDQTWDEMGVGFFGFRYVGETAASFLADRAAKEKAIEEARTAANKIASADSGSSTTAQ
jgi:mono/diheme cytochrome c family protein